MARGFSSTLGWSNCIRLIMHYRNERRVGRTPRRRWRSANEQLLAGSRTADVDPPIPTKQCEGASHPRTRSPDYPTYLLLMASAGWY